jgi:hypothetical protein
MLDLFTRRIPVVEAPSIVPADAFCLVPGRPEDFAKLATASGKYPLWRTQLSGPARNRLEERWYRALCGVVADGVGMHPDVLHFELKYHAGKIIQIVDSPLLGLNVVLKSSTQMDDEEFHIYVQLAEAIMFSRYLPDVRRNDVLARVYELTGLRPPK